MNGHKISVIVPIFCVAEYLSACIESIINQTYKNLEIILVNDGSPDSCPKICDSYALKDSRIKVIHKENGGLSDARNAGIKIATGEYIAFIDSDDYITSNFCEILLQTALKNKADIVECDFVQFANGDPIICEQEHLKDKVLQYTPEEALSLLMKRIVNQVVWNKLYKKDLIAGVLFERDRKHEDEFWTYQIIGKAIKIVKIKAFLYYYRQREESIMGQDYSLQRLDGLDAIEQRMLYMKINFPNLFHSSFKTFWTASSAHYQNLTHKSNLDSNGLKRQMILKNLKKYKSEIFNYQFTAKDIFWLYFFLFAPNAYAKFRNYLEIGK